MDNANILPLSSSFDEISHLKNHINQQILGQNALVNKLLIALLSDGHLLVEGAPGLAKTKAIKALANAIEGNYNRIQFTPDLLPGDLTGSEIYRPEDASFAFQPGPLFSNLVLADEINRAPAKVQSALLEAMAERQTTVGKKTYQLPPLFLVMATQNPIEQEGTYPLPEAQLDRFLMLIKIDYPEGNTEQLILRQAREEALRGNQEAQIKHPLSQQTLFTARKEILNVHVSEGIEQYIIDLILATRTPKKYTPELASWLRFGASPRATIAIDRCAKASAWLNQRDYVIPEDIHEIIYEVLRHRLILSFEAEAQGITTDDVIKRILELVAIP